MLNTLTTRGNNRIQLLTNAGPRSTREGDTYTTRHSTSTRASTSSRLRVPRCSTSAREVGASSDHASSPHAHRTGHYALGQVHKARDSGSWPVHISHLSCTQLGGTRPSAPQRRSPRAPHHLRSLIRCHACPLPRVHPRAPASCPTRPTSERPPLFPLAPSRLSTQPFRPLDGGGRVARCCSHARALRRTLTALEDKGLFEGREDAHIVLGTHGRAVLDAQQ